MVYQNVIDSMYTLLLGFIIVALSIGLLAVWPADTQTTNTTPNSTSYEEQRSADASVSQTPVIAPIISDGDVVNLSGEGLTQTPAYIFSRTATKQLDLSDNQLSGALPAEIRLLTKLQELDLSNNNFTGVPAEIGQLQELEVLDLSNNQLTGLPYELGNLANLQLLDLRGNQYAAQDLELIKEKLSSSVQILVD